MLTFLLHVLRLPYFFHTGDEKPWEGDELLLAFKDVGVTGGSEAVDEVGLDEEKFSAALEESDSVGVHEGGRLL